MLNTYTKNIYNIVQTQQSLMYYLLEFRFHWNHQALLQKYIHPLRGIVKMRYGIPDAYIEPMFTIHVSLFSYCSIWTPVLELKTLKNSLC